MKLLLFLCLFLASPLMARTRHVDGGPLSVEDKSALNENFMRIDNDSKNYLRSDKSPRPAGDSIFDLGASGVEWANLYVDTATIGSTAYSGAKAPLTVDVGAGSGDIGVFKKAGTTVATIDNAGRFRAVDGAAGTPSLSFNSNNADGFYAEGGGIGVATNGVFRWIFLPAGSLNPDGGGTYNIGDSGNYIGDLSYKTLTDRGCLGWFDDGVELQDGRIVSDTEALLAIKKHPTKKTIYGAAMLDYRTFPKVAYKKATIDGKVLKRDANDEPYFTKKGKKTPAADGVEMTSMFSVMIGAIKELALENKALKARLEKLEQ